MTDSAGRQPGASPEARPPPGKIVLAVLRALGSTAALVVIYYLLPLDHASTGAAVIMLVIGLVVLIALVVFQVRSIIASPFPGLRAVEALATSVPLFLLLFASAYVVMATISAGNFSQPMTRTNALYFAVTVFATVGFGDITAKTDVARLVVTGQMIVDLIILGLGARVIVGAVTRGRQRRPQDAGATRPGELGLPLIDSIWLITSAGDPWRKRPEPRDQRRWSPWLSHSATYAAGHWQPSAGPCSSAAGCWPSGLVVIIGVQGMRGSHSDRSGFRGLRRSGSAAVS